MVAVCHPGIQGIINGGILLQLNCSTKIWRPAQFSVNDEFTVSVVIARCQLTGAGFPRWQIRLDTGLVPDITAAVRMDPSNKCVLDYYLLPRIDMSLPKLRLAQENGLSLDGYRFESLDFLFSLAGRTRFAEAA